MGREEPREPDLEDRPETEPEEEETEPVPGAAFDSLMKGAGRGMHPPIEEFPAEEEEKEGT